MYGSGISRIKFACEAAGVRFECLQECGATRLVFHRPGSQLQISSVPLPDGLPAHAAEVLELLGNSGSPMSASQLSGALSLSQSQVRRIIGKLVAMGRAQRVGASVGTRYLLS